MLWFVGVGCGWRKKGRVVWLEVEVWVAVLVRFVVYRRRR